MFVLVIAALFSYCCFVLFVLYCLIVLLFELTRDFNGLCLFGYVFIVADFVFVGCGVFCSVGFGVCYLDCVMYL